MRLGEAVNAYGKATWTFHGAAQRGGSKSRRRAELLCDGFVKDGHYRCGSMLMC